MARGFSEALSAFKSRSGPAWLDAMEIYNVLRGAGAAPIELNGLIGIAAVESAFDPRAEGAIGEKGAWQIERDHVSIETQADNALKSYRAMVEEFSGSGRAPFDKLIDQTPPAMLRIFRAAWQRGSRKPGSITRWLANVKGRYEAMARMQAVGGVPNYATALANMTASGTRKLEAPDFLTFSESEGADKAALERGQNAFRQFMESVSWVPNKRLDPTRTGADYGGPATAAGMAIDYGKEGLWLKDAIRWGFDNIKEGAKELGRQTFKVILPPAALILGGYALYKSMIGGKKSIDEATA